MKNFWKIVMLTVLCVSLLCGVTAMAEADRFQFEKTNLTVFEGNTLELSLIRQGNCAADGELTFGLPATPVWPLWMKTAW